MPFDYLSMLARRAAPKPPRDLKLVSQPAKVTGRKSEDEINLFASNTGTGNQFAAAGAMVYEKARERGLRKEIPTEWLMTDVKKWADRGFFPSP